MVQGLYNLREFIAHRVHEGFESAHEIIENAQNLSNEKYGRDDLLPEIKRLTAEALAAHQAEQAGWGPTTDCDRLGSAFGALNAQGIVARQPGMLSEIDLGHPARPQRPQHDVPVKGHPDL